MKEYSIDNVEVELGFTRDHLVMLALFLGCDYCLGIKGVGIVNAVEIVDAYSDIEALQRFKQWAEKPDYWLDKDIYEECKRQHPREYNYMQKHKNYKKDWELPPNFPDRAVVNAFFEPLVAKNLRTAIGELGHIKYDEIIQFARDELRMGED